MMVPENVKPAIIAPPKPLHNASERVIGINPKIAVNEVKAMASSRDEEASEIDSI